MQWETKKFMWFALLPLKLPETKPAIAPRYACTGVVKLEAHFLVKIRALVQETTELRFKTSVDE